MTICSFPPRMRGGAPDAGGQNGEASLKKKKKKKKKKKFRADVAPSDAGAAPDAPGGPGGRTLGCRGGAGAQNRAAPVVTIDSKVDPETWAEYGGWYRQDYTIYYRPTGHKDKFIYSWPVLTGPLAPKGDKSPPRRSSTSDRQGCPGSCTKCHSVDKSGAKDGPSISPPAIESKRGRFTTFVHEPHFGVMKDRGCLTCHSLEKTRPYLKSYEQSDPQSFVSNFGAAKKELCQTCHASNMASQDCLLCHKYHVNGVVTPIMNTRLPTE